MLKGTYESLPERRRGELLAIVAALAWSTAGILQRQLTLTAATQIAGRAVFALIALVTYVLITQRGQLSAAAGSVLTAPAMLVAVSLAGASGTFVLALNHTTVAHVLVIQAMAPIVAALLGAKVLHERVSARTWTTILLAMVGVAVMVGASGQGSLTGDVIAFGAPVGFAVAIVVTRKHREISMAPATCLSQVLLIVFVGPLASGPVRPHDLIWLALLGAVQLGLGLICFTMAARLITAAELAVISLLEVVLGPVWVWFGVHERPSLATVVGGTVVVLAVMAQIRGPDLATDSQPPELHRPPGGDEPKRVLVADRLSGARGLSGGEPGRGNRDNEHAGAEEQSGERGGPSRPELVAAALQDSLGSVAGRDERRQDPDQRQDETHVVEQNRADLPGLGDPRPEYCRDRRKVGKRGRELDDDDARPEHHA
ncbi:MAG: EamA family transporter [Solirubrobacterales bacterium]|nr:EamA family transporter [Solirubrobacterales bacterium]